MNFTSTTLLRRSLLAAVLAWTSTAPLTVLAADTATFTATLSGAAEVPANTTSGSGSLEATLDKATNQLTWKMTYIGLTGAATGAHFHGPAMPGANAGVVVPFTSAVSPVEGKATLTAPQVADLMAGKWYANVHTAANPGGEIRGQLMLK
jgi:Cu/Zn superoxide dismutase